MNTDLEEVLLNTKDCVNFSDISEFEVKPGKFSPIYVDIKATLSNPSLRRLVTDRLLSIIPKSIDSFCGVESGGSYYASCLADRCGNGFFLFRTKSKEYGLKKRIVGQLPPRGSKIAIVDDVLATGTTIKKVIDFLNSYDYKISAFFVFSYGYENEISKKLGIPIKTGIKFSEVMTYAKKNNIIDDEIHGLINQYVESYPTIINKL